MVSPYNDVADNPEERSGDNAIPENVVEAETVPADIHGKLKYFLCFAEYENYIFHFVTSHGKRTDNADCDKADDEDDQIEQ